LWEDASGAEHNTQHKKEDNQIAHEWREGFHIFINAIQLFNNYFLIFHNEIPNAFCIIRTFDHDDRAGLS
jgi:hypothetical protein